MFMAKDTTNSWIENERKEKDNILAFFKRNRY